MAAHVQWMTASPLWHALVQHGQQEALSQPALLRFASDTFMEDLEVLLQRDPGELIGYLAEPESFQGRPLGEPDTWAPPPPPDLKLYQPVHGHFYLVACSLVCRVPGLPDFRVDVGQGERVSFLLRRLVPAPEGSTSSSGEQAWVVNAQSTGWQPVASPQNLAPNEERFPLFPMRFAEGERSRRLLAGLIPVASRETFQAGPELTPIAPPPEGEDPRITALQTRILQPFEALQALGSGNTNDEEAQQVSLFILLDFADVLQHDLPTVWSAILDGTWSGPAGAKRDLFDQLGTWTVDEGEAVTWRAALVAVWEQRDRINTTGTAEDPPLTFDLRQSSVSHDVLGNVVEDALGPFEPPSTPVTGVTVPKLDPAAGDLYVIRCVYERPRCGPIAPPLVSLASRPFQLAAFFDADAPSRPVHVALPVDTSIAGLRKFGKNVSFSISNKLRQQMERVQNAKLGDIDSGNIDSEPTFDLGMLCSFSLPVITICALILLIIIVQLLNIVFWWLPFFKICLPLNLKTR